MRLARSVVACAAFAFVGSAAAQDASDVQALLDDAKAKIAAGDAKTALEDLTKATALIEAESASLRRKSEALSSADLGAYLAKWRADLEKARAAGGSQAPDLALIQFEISAIRGKAFKKDVPAEAQSSEDFGAMVEESIAKEMPGGKRDDVQEGLRRLGFLPPGFDMKSELADALKTQAAAYYDPKKKKFFNLFSDMPPAFVEATAAHELVHALQDQYHDLDKWFDAHDDSKKIGARDDDRVLALRCVVEGEATFVQTIWQLEHMMNAKPAQATAMARATMPMVAAMDTDQLLKMVKQSNFAPEGSAMAKSMEAADHIEPYVLAPLFAAYMSGAAFIGAVDVAGWDAVDKLYDDPPLTTEQCLHPEKFTKKRDLPTPIAFPTFPEIAAAGWRDSDAAVHGELYLRVLLKKNGVDAAAAKKAAAGWDGDMYRAWRAADGRTAVALATTWDTETDAKEFFDAYKTALATKYPKIAPETGADAQALRFACGEEARGTGALVLRGLEVFAVEGFPQDLRETVVGALLAMKIDHVE